MDFDTRLEVYARHANAPYVQFLRRSGLARDFVKADGSLVWDADGKRFIDCIAGYGNLNLGHNHPRVVEAVVAELRSPRPFNLPFLSEVQARFVEALARVSPGDLDAALVVNSGAEAVDSALKLARLATGKPGIVAMRGAYHGFTFGALAVSEPTMRKAFDPLVPGVVHVPYGDAAAALAAIDARTGCVIVEPIQSEAGCIVPPEGYLRALVDGCAARRVVLVFDEVKTGIAKTGRLFACEHEGAVPDLLLAGKSLGGGAAPIGAVIGKRSWWGRLGLSFPMSSSSGAGNALACAAGLASLAVVEEEKLAEQAERKGLVVLAALEAIGREYPGVAIGASGRGLLAALHFNGAKSAGDVVAACARRGVLVMVAFCDRTRILFEPPLAIDDAILAEALAVLRDAVAEVAEQTATKR
jgi:putrescine aminotransferase